MGNIPNLDTLINKLSSGGGGNPQNIFFFKEGFISSSATSIGSTTVGQWTSLWNCNGFPSAISIYPPLTAQALSGSMTGALRTYQNAQVNQNWLLGGTVMGGGTLSNIGTVLVYDRLAHISGLSGSVTTPQIVSETITRYSGSTTCIGNQLWLEVYQRLGATNTGINITYKNQNGTTAVTPTASIGGVLNICGFQAEQTMWPIALAPGDTGVQSVDRVIIQATTGNSGSFGVTIVRPLMLLPLTTQFGGSRDLVSDICAPVFVEANACIAFAFQSTIASASIQFLGQLTIVEA